MKHYDPVAGLWLASSSDEEWPRGPFFDEREEAIAYGHAAFDDGAGFYVGTVRVVVDEQMAAGALLRHDEDAEWRLCEDNDLSAEDPLIEIPLTARGDLVRVVAMWLHAKKCVREWFQVNNTEHVVSPPPADQGV